MTPTSMRSSAGRWPNFFIVGAPRAATTSLYRYLRQHPAIFMPDLKEPHFFMGGPPPPPDRKWRTATALDPAHYASLFEGAHAPAIGEASTGYLWSTSAASEIAKVAPDARIIALLRDPIERAHSQYTMEKRFHWETLPFDEAIDADLADRTGDYWSRHLYVEMSLYHDALLRYVDAFGRENVHVILFDDLRDRPQRTTAKALEFLGVDPTLVDRMTFEVHNAYQAPKNPFLARIYESPLVRRMAKPLPRAWREKAGRAMVKPTVRPPGDVAAWKKLAKIFEPDVTRLEEFLGRPLPELRRTWP